MIDRQILKSIVMDARADSRAKDGKGPDWFVEEIIQNIGPDDLFNTYKLAWNKLTELLVILDKAQAKLLDPHDVLGIMTYLLTSSVCIKDKAKAS